MIRVRDPQPRSPDLAHADSESIRSYVAWLESLQRIAKRGSPMAGTIKVWLARAWAVEDPEANHYAR